MTIHMASTWPARTCAPRQFRVPDDGTSPVVLKAALQIKPARQGEGSEGTERKGE